MTGILEQLKWESLKKRRKDNRLKLLYKGLKGKARIPTDDLVPKTRRCRNQHSMAFQLPSASVKTYKCSFFPQTFCTLAKIPASEQLFVCGDWNGHIGSQSTGFEEAHGGQAIGKRNTEGERVLEFAFANELVVGNTWFKKKPEHLVTYQSGNAATQIDFILCRRSFRKQVSNVKVILGEEIAPQHRLLVGDFRVSVPPQPKRKFMPRIKVWKLRDPEKQAELSEVFKAKTQDSELSQTSSVDVRWTSLKDKLLQATKQVCGVSSNHPWRKQTWWWNNQVEEAVRENRRCFKL